MRLVVLLLFLAFPGAGQAECRLALALGLDVSGSVDEREYRLQYLGLAAALSDDDVQQSIFAIPEAPVALAIYEWSSSTYQKIVLDWIILRDTETLTAVRTRLTQWQRGIAPETPGLGQAIAFGRQIFDKAPRCWDQTLDISGDGKNNDWPPPKRVRESGAISDLRINALVIATDQTASELTAYFQERVIQGPDAFVEVALGYSDYAEAMKRKLLRELEVLAIGSLESKGQ